MKKYFKYIPHIIFAVALLGIGAFGKLTGSESAKMMFEQINMFGLGEQFGRIAVGLGQVAAALGIFCKKSQKISALLGSAIMAGAITYHLNFGGNPTLAIVIMVIGFYLLLKKEPQVSEKE